MEKANNQKKELKNPSRREFLKRAAKGGSIAALITSGALDLELKHLLFAQKTQKFLTQEALKSSLPSRGLEMLRKILIGEFFPGGRFWEEGKLFGFRNRRPCDPHLMESGDRQKRCEGQFNCPRQEKCPSNCPDQGCGDYECDTHTCPDGFRCPDFGCGNDVCGGIVGGCPDIYGSLNIDPTKLSAFDVGEIGKYATTQFIQELMQVMNLRTTQALEEEIERMIRNRESLKMKGYIR